MSRRKPRALVIGGSLGGFFATNMLRQVCSWDHPMHERDLAEQPFFQA